MSNGGNPQLKMVTDQNGKGTKKGKKSMLPQQPGKPLSLHAGHSTAKFYTVVHFLNGKVKVIP